MFFRITENKKNIQNMNSGDQEVVILPLADRGKLERVNRKLIFPGTKEDPIVVDDEPDIVDLTKEACAELSADGRHQWTEAELLAFIVDDEWPEEDSGSYREDSCEEVSDEDYNRGEAHSLDEDEVAEVMSEWK